MKTEGLLEIDPNERVIMVIKRHWAGLIPILLAGAATAAAGVSAIWVLLRYQSNIEQFIPLIWVLLGLVVLVALLLLGVGISLLVYTKNIMILTNEKIVQVLYFSLFKRQISRLLLQDIQDVTYLQAGMGTRVFKYGTIRIETAGEAAHFEFPYAANPHQVSQQIGALCEELRRV